MSDENATTRPVDVLVTHLPRTHQLQITWRPDLGINVLPGGLNGVRWLTDGRGWTLPVLGAVELMGYLRNDYADLRISFDTGAAKVIFESLSREANSASLSLAEDGDVPDVLTVKLHPFQRAALAYLLRGLPRKILALDTGLGKTAVACAYARIRQARTLWVTKAALANNLEREIRKLTGQTAHRLVGSNPSVQDIEILQDVRHQHIVMTYESLSLSLQENDSGHGSMWAIAISVSPFDLLVMDEAHNIKNRDAKRWKVAFSLRSIPSVLFLTATPVVNVGTDLFSLLTILDNNIYGSESEYIRAYMSMDGKRVMQPKKLQSDLLPYMFRRKKTDVLKDLPPKIRQHHAVEMTEKFRQAYRLVSEGLFTTLKGDEKEVPDMILAQINRFRQVVSYAKVENTVELAMTLEESGEKTLIFTAWKDSAVEIARQLSCKFINGDIPQDERTEIQDDFNDNPRTKHLVLTLDVGREGLNLTGGTAIVFNDYGWNPMIHDQAEGRAWGRLNDIHGCLVYYVEIKDSIDSFMMGTLDVKQRLIDSAVEGQRAYASESVSMLQGFLKYVKENPSL